MEKREAEKLIGAIKEERIKYAQPASNVLADVYRFIFNDLKDLTIKFQTFARFKYVVGDEDIPAFAMESGTNEPTFPLKVESNSMSFNFKPGYNEELIASRILDYVKINPDEKEYIAYVFFPSIYFIFLPETYTRSFLNVVGKIVDINKAKNIIDDSLCKEFVKHILTGLIICDFGFTKSFTKVFDEYFVKTNVNNTDLETVIKCFKYSVQFMRKETQEAMIFVKDMFGDEELASLILNFVLAKIFEDIRYAPEFLVSNRITDNFFIILNPVALSNNFKAYKGKFEDIYNELKLGICQRKLFLEQGIGNNYTFRLLSVFDIKLVHYLFDGKEMPGKDNKEDKYNGKCDLREITNIMNFNEVKYNFRVKEVSDPRWKEIEKTANDKGVDILTLIPGVDTKDTNKVTEVTEETISLLKCYKQTLQRNREAFQKCVGSISDKKEESYGLISSHEYLTSSIDETERRMNYVCYRKYHNKKFLSFEQKKLTDVLRLVEKVRGDVLRLFDVPISSPNLNAEPKDVKRFNEEVKNIYSSGCNVASLCQSKAKTILGNFPYSNVIFSVIDFFARIAEKTVITIFANKVNIKIEIQEREVSSDAFESTDFESTKQTGEEERDILQRAISIISTIIGEVDDDDEGREINIATKCHVLAQLSEVIEIVFTDPQTFGDGIINYLATSSNTDVPLEMRQKINNCLYLEAVIRQCKKFMDEYGENFGMIDEKAGINILYSLLPKISEPTK